MSMRSILRRLGVLYPFDIEEIEKAEAENALRENDAALNRVATSNGGIRAAQSKLKESISAALNTAQPHADRMSQLVHDMRSSGRDEKRN